MGRRVHGGKRVEAQKLAHAIAIRDLRAGRECRDFRDAWGYGRTTHWSFFYTIWWILPSPQFELSDDSVALPERHRYGSTMDLEQTLASLTGDAIAKAFDLESADPLLRAADPKFGDYQINAAMKLARSVGKPPREVGAEIAEAIRSLDAVAEAEVAGPGFVNVKLDNAWLANELSLDLKGDLRIPKAEPKEKIVIDYSSPNIAKQMHVGHLRSTVLGHALVQILRSVGHEVIGDNHLGDWGTQFGLLIVGLETWGTELNVELESASVKDLEQLYKRASARAKQDEEFAERARGELAKLQRGDEANLAIWRRFVEVTLKTNNAIYERLGVRFEETLGESFYNEMLPGVVEEVTSRGLAREDQGALCVFFKEIDPKEHGKPKMQIPKRLKNQPVILRKRDGAATYSTTDVATIQHRENHFKADRTIYVVDDRQGLHFAQIFALAELLGLSIKADHVGFGKILGDDGTPLKTRGGDNIALGALLDEAVARAKALIEEKSNEGVLRISADELDAAAEIIGTGAVKFGDLAQNRTTDYRFDWEKLIAFSGNSSPYLQYQYARCRSVFREAGIEWESAPTEMVFTEAAEGDLARELARFGDTVARAAKRYEPHLICERLYELARAFSRFWTQCRVLGAETEEAKMSRLALVALTGRQLERGLELIGIGVLEAM